MELLPWQAKQKYCSTECYFGHPVAAPTVARVISCQVCDKPKRVRGFRLAEGYGKFCSRRCYGLSKRMRVTLTCRQCHRHFSVVLSQAARRRYCRRRCATLARLPQEYRCRTCGTMFRAPAWRRRRYCDLKCSNRGRKGRQHPALAARDARILELRARGLNAPDIQRQIVAEDLAWLTTPEAVRQVIHRAGVTAR
jgi:hypothetical protein